MGQSFLREENIQKDDGFPPILIPLFVPFRERLCMMLPEALSDAVIRYQWEAHSVGLVERHAHTVDNCLLITLLTRVRERGLQGAPLPTAEWNTVLAPPPSREPRACYCPQPLSGATVSPPTPADSPEPVIVHSP